MTQNPPSTVSTISGRQAQKKDEKKSVQLDFIKNNPLLASTANILLTDRDNKTPSKDKRNALIKSARATALFASLTTIQTQRIRDAEMIKKHLTDLKFVETILVSSILSPKDLVKTELSYGYHESTSLPPTVAMGLLSVIKSHFKTGYKIEDRLSSILSESLFRSGSDPHMVLPETAMDKLINGEMGSVSLEDYTNNVKKVINETLLIKPDSKSIKPMNSVLTQKNTVMDILLDAKPKEERTTKVKRKIENIEKEFDLEKDLEFSITDNIDILKMPAVIKKVADKISMEAYFNGDNSLDISMEQYIEKNKSNTYSEESNSPYSLLSPDNFMVGGRDRQMDGYNEIVIIDDINERPNIGHPTIIRWPAESIFPVKIPGDREKCAGYFAMVDESGNPITMDLTDFYVRNMASTNTSTSGSLNNSNIINSATLQKWGITSENNNMKHEQYLYAQKLYASLAEMKILEEIRNGVYGEDVEINAKQEIFKIMFARALSNKRTRLVFIPNTLMTYFAFHYDENGLGVSLIELNKEIETQRVVIDYALSLANLKAAIPQYKIDITLDDVEEDPEEAIDMMLHNFVKTQRATNVFNIGSPADTVMNLILFGAKVNVEDHPNYPKVEFNAESSTGNYDVPDTDWSDKLEDRSHMGYGIPSEIIKSFTGTDFATTAVLDNLMLMKTATELSNKFVPQIRQFIINYVLASGTLMKELADVLKEHVDQLSDEDKKIPIKRRIKMFLDELEVTLPTADTKYNETTKEQLDNFIEVVDSIVDKTLSEFMSDSDLLGDDAEQLDRLKNYVKSHCIQDYIVRNNVVPSLTTILTNPVDEMNVFVDSALNRNKDLKQVLEYIKNKVAEATGSNEEGSKLDEDGNPIEEQIVEAGVHVDEENAFGNNTDYESTQGRNDAGWSINAKPPETEDVNPKARPD